MTVSTGAPGTWPDAALRWLTVWALAAGAAVLAISVNNPLVEAHGFRQAQTAMAAYWMLHGAPWIDYWTPVFGPPWSIPFEFPLYQWLLAAITGATGLPLNAVGRVVSYLWLLASLPPALGLLRAYPLPPLTARFYLVLLLASPLYLFWGRAVLIETQALALALWFLWATRRALAGRNPAVLALAVLAGTAAALTKVTTWGPFLAAAAAMTLHQLWVAERWPARARAAAVGVIAALPGLVAVALWNRHADALKSLQPLADGLRSNAPAMVAWNFGPLSERVSAAYWMAQARALVDMFGLIGPVMVVIVGVACRRAAPGRHATRAILALVALYELPWLVLANLHAVHNYYQTANGLFGIAAMAVALAAIAAAGRADRAALLCIACVASQAIGFAGQYARSLVVPELAREWAVAQALRAGTRPGEVVVAYGLDWSPVVAYEAGLLARMEPDWVPLTDLRARVPGLTPAAIGGRRLAAVVRCPSRADDDPVARARLDVLAVTWRTVTAEDCRISFAPLG